MGIELPYEIRAFLGSASQRVAAALAGAVDGNDESPFNVGAGQLAQEAMERKGERESKSRKKE